MSSRIFIYYCVLCGGGAALLSWLLTVAIRLDAIQSDLLHSVVLSAIVGMAVSGVLGAVDAVLNAPRNQRLIRISGSAVFGLMGGVIAGMLCDLLANITPWIRFLGWMILGVAIGASIHLYDVIQCQLSGKPFEMARVRLTKAMIGGAIGGGVGGLLFSFLDLTRIRDTLPRTSLVLSLVILGMSIGLFVGLAQLLRKEAWIRVKSGIRPGHELVLAKEETTIGRATSCDLGLLDDTSIDPVHARIERQGEFYFLKAGDGEGATFLNNRRVTESTQLHDGDSLRIGSSILVFGERAKGSG